MYEIEVPPTTIESIRKRPGMYVGDSGSYGLQVMLEGILDAHLDRGQR
mgnify:CR=1 FL=1